MQAVLIILDHLGALREGAVTPTATPTKTPTPPVSDSDEAMLSTSLVTRLSNSPRCRESK